VKNFLRLANRKDAKWVKIRRVPGKGPKEEGKKVRERATKFKVRTSKFLYTLVVHNRGRAAKLKKALPKNVERRTAKKRAPPAEKTA
jgi:large subunit ribosomal protein L38e